MVNVQTVLRLMSLHSGNVSIKLVYIFVSHYKSETLNSPLNTIAGISNVASTCEQIPSLDLHLDESSVFYQLKPDKEDNLTEIFKPELDRFGLMGHTHFNYSLNDLKARALGVRYSEFSLSNAYGFSGLNSQCINALNRLSTRTFSNTW